MLGCLRGDEGWIFSIAFHVLCLSLLPDLTSRPERKALRVSQYSWKGRPIPIHFQSFILCNCVAMIVCAAVMLPWTQRMTPWNPISQEESVDLGREKWWKGKEKHRLENTGGNRKKHLKVGGTFEQEQDLNEDQNITEISKYQVILQNLGRKSRAWTKITRARNRRRKSREIGWPWVLDPHFNHTQGKQIQQTGYIPTGTPYICCLQWLSLC